jgi:hypothetical protein
MRFLPHEHTAITAALSAYGVDPSTVLFVKRRGRLHVQVPGRTDTFTFFRKKSTTIDDAHQWQHRTDYYIGMSKPEAAGATWTDVVTAFNAWLSAGGA